MVKVLLHRCCATQINVRPDTTPLVYFRKASIVYLKEASFDSTQATIEAVKADAGFKDVVIEGCMNGYRIKLLMSAAQI